LMRQGMSRFTGKRSLKGSNERKGKIELAIG
jgi:hypothetical protein